MEKYKQTLQKRLYLTIGYNALVLVLLALGILHVTGSSNPHVNDYISGFNLGLCVGVQMLMLLYMRKYRTAMKNADMLKELYIKEHDERTQFISAQIGGKGINIVICGLALGAMIAGYFHETVFFTLMGATLFTVFTKLGLKIFYLKKY